MTTARDKSHNAQLDKLNECMLEAFSKEVSGEKDPITLAEWKGALFLRIVSLHDKVNVDAYNNLAVEFKCSDTRTNKLPILTLMGEMHRIAASIDLICQFEAENIQITAAQYQKKMFAQCEGAKKNMESTSSKERKHSVDLKDFHQNKQIFVETFKKVGNEHVNACAVNNLGFQFLNHQEEIKNLQSQVAELEKKYDEAKKQELIEKINAQQLKFKQLAKGDLVDPYKPLANLSSEVSGSRFIQQYQNDHKSLVQHIEVLNQDLGTECKTNSLVPCITVTHENALRTIKQLAIEEAKTVVQAVKIKSIQSTIDWIHVKSSWLLPWRAHTQWDNLRNHCVELYNNWAREGNKSIEMRVNTIFETRDKLLNEQEDADSEHSKSIKAQQSELEKEVKELDNFHAGFCRQVIQLYQQEFLKQLEANQASYQAIEKDYANLLQRLKLLQPKKVVTERKSVSVTERKSVSVAEGDQTQLKQTIIFFGLNPAKATWENKQARFVLDRGLSLLFTKPKQAQITDSSGKSKLLQSMPSTLLTYVPPDLKL
jgi:hypothetical protein